MARSTFKVLFYVNGSKEKDGIVPIMGRVTAQPVQPRGGSDAAGADFLFHQPPEILKPSGDDAWSDVFRPRHGRELFRQGRSFRRGGQQVVQDGVHLIRPFRGGVRHAGERLARHVLDKKGARVRRGFPVGDREGI